MERPALLVNPQRRRRRAIGALAIVSLIMAGGFSVMTLSRAAQLDVDRVVVAPLENQTGDTALNNLGPMAAHWIADVLLTQGVDALPGVTALTAWNYTQEQIASKRVRDPVRGLAEATGAGTVIWGNYQLEKDGSLLFRAEVTNAVIRRVSARPAPVTGSRSALLNAIDTLAQRVTSAVLSASPNMQQNRSGQVAAVGARPPTLEAYRAFMEGIAAGSKRAQWKIAQQHHLRAARLDTTFIWALLWAGFATLYLGENARADSLAGVADKRAGGRLSVAEKGLLDWIRADARGDYGAVIEANGPLARLAPLSGFTFNLGFYASVLGRPREGIKVSRRLPSDRGFAVNFVYYYAMLARMHHVLGEHRRELRAAQAGRQHFPGSSIHLASELRARPDTASRTLGGPAGYAALLNVVGEYDEAYRIFANLVRQNPGNIANQGNRAFSAARLGRREEAMRISQELAQLDKTFLKGGHTYLRAQIAAALGDNASAAQLLGQALQHGKHYDDELHRNLALQFMRDDPALRAILRPKG